MQTTRPMVLVTAGLALLALQPLAARAELLQISDMFVFGDSLSDGGNSGLLTQAAAGVVFPPVPYAGGRYSNGPQPWSNSGTSTTATAVCSRLAGVRTSRRRRDDRYRGFNEITSSVPPDLQPRTRTSARSSS